MLYSRVGPWPYPQKPQTRLDRLARDKHSSLLRKFVNYSRKKPYSTGPQGLKSYSVISVQKIIFLLVLRKRHRWTAGRTDGLTDRDKQTDRKAEGQTQRDRQTN
jgi:hypothetical protein